MRIPTILGLLLLLLFLGGFIVLFERIARVSTTASATIVPTNVEITNITDVGFTTTWITDSPATGTLVVSGGKTKSQTVFDERDTAGGKLGSYSTHSVTFRGAEPDTQYSVSILSNGKQHLDNGKPYQIRTGMGLSGSVNLEPAHGSVRTFDNQPATGALVYLTLLGSQKLSTLVTTSGAWLIPLTLIRSEDLLTYVVPEERTTETLLVRLGKEESQAITDTLNDAPVPEMQLGKTYDFRRQQASAQPNILGETAPPGGGVLVSLVKPAQGAAIPTSFPLIQGTGIPGKSVAITLGITNPVAGTTTVGADGIWRFTPTVPLAPGKQSVTVTSVDTLGKSVAITHTFEVLKSGTQVLGEATPSATPTLSATASPTPTSTLAGQPVPQSGNSLPAIILLILGLGLFASGAVVFVK